MPAEDDKKPNSQVADPLRAILNDFFSNPLKGFGRSFSTQTKPSPPEEESPSEPRPGPTEEDFPDINVPEERGGDGK